MQIQSQLPVVDTAKAAADVASQKPTGTSAGSSAGLANETTFLQLLVAQIKNQDPLQPTDGVQFLSQLAQFSQLEQLIGLRQDLQNNQPEPTESGSTTN